MSIIRVARKFNKILSSQQKIRMTMLIVLMIIGGVLEMCSVSLIIPFMNLVMNPDRVMQAWYAKLAVRVLGIESSRAFLVFVASLLAFIYILKNLFLLVEYNFQYRFVYHNMFAMQSKLLFNYIHRPYEYFLHADSGEMIRIVNNDTPSAFDLLTTILNFLTELIVSGMLIIAVFLIAPAATVGIAVIMGIAMLAISKFVKPILHKAGLDYQASTAAMNKWLLQSIHGIKELKVMSKEEFFQNNFDLAGRISVQSLRKNRMLSMVPRFIIEAVSMGALFVLIAILIYMGAELESLVPMLSAIAMAAMRLLPSVNRISSSLANIAYYEPMLDKLLLNVEDMERHTYTGGEGKKPETYNHRPKQLKEALLLSHICYRYPNAEIDVLQDASMEIKKGESIGIVGSSGAGKTTLVDIILGLLQQQSGEVLGDGIDVRGDLASWYRQIGYIPQMIFMLDDTIRANVAFGIPDDEISDRAVDRALREASLLDYVNTLPDGVNTEIGERGIRLSGGQRQRVGIARALYRNPNVLIFDEATSALDNDTEADIMESINKLQGTKTVIVIAHRLTTIASCDHVYRVEAGKITNER